MLAEDHEYQIQNPNDGKSENQTENTRHDIAVSESRYKAEHPRRYGNDRKDKTDDIGQAKIIAFRISTHINTSDVIL